MKRNSKGRAKKLSYGWVTNVQINLFTRISINCRAQQYYASNIFAMASGNALGTMAVFAIPSILDMLVFTKNSSVPKTAYKRYVETLLHLVTWYQHDLKPGSK